MDLKRSCSLQFSSFLFPVNAIGNNLRAKVGNKFLVFKIYLWWVQNVLCLLGSICVKNLCSVLVFDGAPCSAANQHLISHKTTMSSYNIQINEYAPNKNPFAPRNWVINHIHSSARIFCNFSCL